MAATSHLSYVFGPALSLVLALAYLHPAEVNDWLGRRPALQALSWNPGKVETERDTLLREVLREHTNVQTRIAREVLSGKRTLFEAAACFRLLKVLQQPLTKRRLARDACNSAVLCEEVIRWVDTEGTAAHSPELPRVLRELKIQLHAVQKHSGQIALPTVSPEAFWESSGPPHHSEIRVVAPRKNSGGA